MYGESHTDRSPDPGATCTVTETRPGARRRSCTRGWCRLRHQRQAHGYRPRPSGRPPHRCRGPIRAIYPVSWPNDRRCVGEVCKVLGERVREVCQVPTVRRSGLHTVCRRRMARVSQQIEALVTVAAGIAAANDRRHDRAPAGRLASWRARVDMALQRVVAAAILDASTGACAADDHPAGSQRCAIRRASAAAAAFSAAAHSSASLRPCAQFSPDVIPTAGASRRAA